MIAKAAGFGRIDIISFLLERGADKNCKDKWGVTPLHEASLNNHEDICLKLLDVGANLGSKDINGKTPLDVATPQIRSLLIEKSLRHVAWELFHASKKGNLETIRHLVESGRVDLNMQDWDDRAPLHLACEYNHPVLVEWMLQYGANKNVQDKWGVTPAIESIKKGNSAIAVILLEAGADMSLPDSTGKRPLEYANPELRKLLEEKLDLWNSAQRGDLDSVRHLIESGSMNVDAEDKDGSTCLFSAVAGGHLPVIKYLLVHGADINKKNGRGETPLMYSLANKHEQVALYLLDQGGDVNAQTDKGLSPLFFALRSRKKKLIRALFTKGAMFDGKEKNLRGLLMEAAKANDPEFFHIIFDEQNIAIDMSTLVDAYLLAAKTGSDNVVAMCLRRGVNPSSTDEKKRTAIHETAQNGHSKLLRMLLEDYKVDVNLKDTDERTALFFAAEQGHCECAEICIANGATADFQDDAFGHLFSAAVRSNNLSCALVLVEKGVPVSSEVLDEIENNMSKNKTSLLEGLPSGADKYEVGQFYASILQNAAANGRAKCVMNLISAGIDVNYVSPDGQTPLHLSARNGHAEVVDHILSSRGFNNTDGRNKEGLTPLHLAAMFGHEAIVRLLAEKGHANIRLETLRQETALILAIIHRHLNVAQYLVDRDADPLQLDMDGFSPYDHALVLDSAEKKRVLQQTALAGGVVLGNAALTTTATVGHAFVDMLIHLDEVKGVRRRFALRTLWKQSAAYFLAVLFLCVVVIHGSTKNDVHGFEFTRALRIHLQENFHDFELVQNSYMFTDQQTYDAFWEFLQKFLLPRLFDDAHPNETYILEGKGKLLGPIRLRQVRTSLESCLVKSPFDHVIHRCFKAKPDTESRENFGIHIDEQWGEAFHWRSADELGGIKPLTGLGGEYSGGGFALDFLPHNLSSASDAIDALKKGEWLDMSTRAVMLQMSIYNNNIDLTADVHLTYEFLPTGGIHDLFLITVVPLFHHVDILDFVFYGLQLLLFFFFAMYMVSEVRDLIREGRRYWLQPMRYYDGIVHSLFLIGAAIHLTVQVFVAKLEIPTGEKFVTYEYAVGLQAIKEQIFAIVVILAGIKTLRFLQIFPVSGPILQAVFQTFLSPGVLTFVMVFFIVLFSSALALHIALAIENESYRNIGMSLEKVFTVTFGDFRVGLLSTENEPVVGPFLFALFLISVALVMINLFISVFIETYRDAQRSQREQWNDYITRMMEMEPRISKAADKEAVFQLNVEQRWRMYERTNLSKSLAKKHSRAGVHAVKRPTPSTAKEMQSNSAVINAAKKFSQRRRSLAIGKTKLMNLQTDLGFSSPGPSPAKSAKSASSVSIGSATGSTRRTMFNPLSLLGSAPTTSTASPLNAVIRIPTLRVTTDVHAEDREGGGSKPPKDHAPDEVQTSVIKRCLAAFKSFLPSSGPASDDTGILTSTVEFFKELPSKIRRIPSRLRGAFYKVSTALKKGVVKRKYSVPMPPSFNAGESDTGRKSSVGRRGSVMLQQAFKTIRSYSMGGASTLTEEDDVDSVHSDEFLEDTPAWNHLRSISFGNFLIFVKRKRGWGGMTLRGGGTSRGGSTLRGTNTSRMAAGEQDADRQAKKVARLELDLVGLKTSLEKSLLDQSEQVRRMKHNLESISFLQQDNIANVSDKLDALVSAEKQQVRSLHSTVAELEATGGMRKGTKASNDAPTDGAFGQSMSVPSSDAKNVSVSGKRPIIPRLTGI